MIGLTSITFPFSKPCRLCPYRTHYGILGIGMTGVFFHFLEAVLLFHLWIFLVVSDFHFSISSFGMDAAISIHPFRYQAYSRSVSSPAPCRQQGQLQNSLIFLPCGQHAQGNYRANYEAHECQHAIEVHLLVLPFTAIRPINANYCIQDTADYIKNHFQHRHSPHREYLGPSRLPDTFGTSHWRCPSGPGNPRSPYSSRC